MNINIYIHDICKKHVTLILLFGFDFTCNVLKGLFNAVVHRCVSRTDSKEKPLPLGKHFGFFPGDGGHA